MAKKDDDELEEIGLVGEKETKENTDSAANNDSANAVQTVDNSSAARAGAVANNGGRTGNTTSGQTSIANSNTQQTSQSQTKQNTEHNSQSVGSRQFNPDSFNKSMETINGITGKEPKSAKEIFVRQMYPELDPQRYAAMQEDIEKRRRAHSVVEGLRVLSDIAAASAGGGVWKREIKYDKYDREKNTLENNRKDAINKLYAAIADQDNFRKGLIQQAFNNSYDTTQQTSGTSSTEGNTNTNSTSQTMQRTDSASVGSTPTGSSSSSSSSSGSGSGSGTTKGNWTTVRRVVNGEARRYKVNLGDDNSAASYYQAAADVITDTNGTKGHQGNTLMDAAYKKIKQEKPSLFAMGKGLNEEEKAQRYKEQWEMVRDIMRGSSYRDAEGNLQKADLKLRNQVIDYLNESNKQMQDVLYRMYGDEAFEYIGEATNNRAKTTEGVEVDKEEPDYFE